jgi:methylated-DNA-protein-cysteine methyltransferase-like protein
MSRRHASRRSSGREGYEAIYAVVRRIPSGRLATYGQIAELASRPGHARQVGYALHALPADTTVPWHRVINARGMVSTRSHLGNALHQRLRLEAEGIVFDAKDRADLDRYRWRPRTSA